MTAHSRTAEATKRPLVAPHALLVVLVLCTTCVAGTIISAGIANTVLLSPAVAASRVASANVSGASTPRTPKVIQLSYSRWYDGHSLLAFARHTDSLRFATRYRGRRVSAPARISNVIDTDIKDEEAARGWQPIRERGGRIKRLIRRALEQRGWAKVRTRAKRDGVLDDHWWRIVLGRCSQDPPLYPVDCEIARSGRHFRLSRSGI